MENITEGLLGDGFDSAGGGFSVPGSPGEHPVGSGIRNYVIENGLRETGALNLVTAIYLGYRAFDTLGETIVLLLAVSGVLLFTERQR